MIIIPYSGLLAPFFDDLIMLAKHINKTSVAIQENWDNLSSKTLFRHSPDSFLVWSDQSKGFLRKIHNYAGQVEVVGSPRFRPYFVGQPLDNLDSYKFKSTKESNYILFAGTGDGIDDCFILNLILSIDSISNQAQNQELFLIYRPHPFTRLQDISSIMNRFLHFPGFAIDDGVDSKAVFHHINLIKNAKLVVCQFSTMLLESLIAKTPVVMPTFVDRNVSFDYKKALTTWEHFESIEKVPGAYVTENKKEFADILNMLYFAVNKPFVGSVEYYCQSGDPGISIRDFLLNNVRSSM
jgi:hypothetical protein